MGVENRVRTLIKAFIDGSTNISAHDIAIAAKDNTSIDATTTAVSKPTCPAP